MRKVVYCMVLCLLFTSVENRLTQFLVYTIIEFHVYKVSISYRFNNIVNSLRNTVYRFFYYLVPCRCDKVLFYSILIPYICFLLIKS